MPPPADARAGRAILRGGGATGLGFLVRFGARFAFLFVAARLYGAVLLGAYAVALAAVEIAVMAGLVGARWLIFQWIDERAPGVTPRAVVGQAILLVAVTSLVIAAGVGGVALVAPLAPATGAALVWLAPTIVLQAQIELLLAATRWSGVVRYDVIGKSVVQPYVGVVAAIAAWGAGWRETGLPASYLAASAVTLGYAWWGMKRSIPGDGARGGPGQVEMAAQGWPVALSETIDGVFARLDLWLVGALLGEAAAGVYGMAKQIAVVIRQVRQSFDGMLVPIVSRTLARAGEQATAAAIASAVRLILIAQLPVLVAFAAIGAPLLHLFGGTFTAGYAALSLLAAAEIVQGAFGVSDLVFAYRRPRLGLAITLASVAAALVVAPPLLRWLGISGAALALLTCYGARAAARRLLLARVFGIATPIASAGMPLAIGGAATMAALALRVWPFAALATGLGLYAGLLWWWRRRADIALIPAGFVDGTP